MPIKRTLMKFTSIKSHQSYHCLVCKQKQAYYTANNVLQSSIIGRPPKFSGKSPGNREVCLGVVYQGEVGWLWRVRTTRETMVSDVRHNRSHCDVTPPGAAARGRLLRHIPEVGPPPTPAPPAGSTPPITLYVVSGVAAPSRLVTSPPIGRQVTGRLAASRGTNCIRWFSAYLNGPPPVCRDVNPVSTSTSENLRQTY